MALSGMTGFGRADGTHGAWTWTVEARCVNGRSLEPRFRGPTGFDQLDRAARDAAQARFQRGQLTINLQAKRSEATGAARVNLEQLERYLAVAGRYVDEGRAAAPSLDGLLALRGVIEAAEELDGPEAHAEVEAAMAVSIGEALEALKAARLAEGAALAPVLDGLIDRVETLVGQAEAEAAGQPAILKERFARRIAELLADRGDLEERIVQEAAVMATKADVREELDRLTSHVAAARGLLAGEGASGRRLDFLTQEFMREANTLCSKSATTALTGIGLELKATIDQFREQVQNVE
ncbi:MAG: YicC family protein [Caulobacteraceae bacterium]|nr:YicC family protein [Caulobacteraceae bacterium]